MSRLSTKQRRSRRRNGVRSRRRRIMYIFGTGEIHFLHDDGTRRTWVPLDSVECKERTDYINGLKDGGEVTFEMHFEPREYQREAIKQFITKTTPRGRSRRKRG